jgi:hypothetical protein
MFRLALLLCVALPSPALADAGAPVPAFVGQGPGQLPANTEVVFSLNEALSSGRVREGTRVSLSVAQDVVADGQIVIPRGTLGRGEVVSRSGRGGFGRSGKMEVAVRSLRLNGRDVAMAGTARTEGRGGTAETIGAIIGGGLLAGAFVTGRNATLAQGELVRGYTLEPVALAAPVPVRVTSWAPMAVRTAAPVARNAVPAVQQGVRGGDARQGWTISD